MRNLLITLIISIVSAIGLCAQQSLMCAGGDATGTGGTGSFSIGQVFFSVSSGPDGNIIQGVQQPFEISIISSVPNIDYISLSATLYPIPADDHVNLKITGNEFDKMSYQLIDMTGKVLENSEVKSSITMISLTNLALGNYFLRINKKNQLIRSFKIIKK